MIKMQLEDRGGIEPIKELTPEVEKAIELIDKLEDQEKKKVAHMLLVHTEFSGPIPPPAMLAKYEEIEDGLASRIVRMAEKEQDASISERSRLISLAGRDTLLGSLFSFILVLSVIGFGVYALFHDKEIAGYGLLISGVLGVAKLFISSSSNSNDVKNSSEEKDG